MFDIESEEKATSSLELPSLNLVKEDEVIVLNDVKVEGAVEGTFITADVNAMYSQY